MPGIESGKTWSRIGAEVAPTSSAASGVWGSLNEVAGYVGAGTWPTHVAVSWAHIATLTPTTGQSVTFTSIPATYQHLVVKASIVSTGGDAKLRLGYNTTTPTSTDNFSTNISGTGSNIYKALNAWTYLAIQPWAYNDSPWFEETWVYDYALAGMATVGSRRAYSGGKTTAANQSWATDVHYPNYLGTAAVTSLTYMWVEANADFAAGTKIDLYGVGDAI